MTAAPTTTASRSTGKSWGRRLFWLAIVIAAAALVTWGAWLVERFVFFNFHEVVAGQVYRCAQPNATFFEKAIKEYHIQSVLKLNRNSESGWSRDEEQVLNRLGVKLIYLPIGVTELPSRQDMLKIVEVLETAPTPVLVHCKNGADRTGFAAILAEMRAGKTLDQAWDDQMKLRYLRVGHIGDDVGDVFDQYRSDCAGHPGLGTWGDFRAYVMEGYWPSFYRARIEPDPARTNAAAGQAVHFKVKVTNASPRKWTTTSAHPFFLALQQPREHGQIMNDNLARADLPELSAGQSATVDLNFNVPPGTASGEHSYMLDVIQQDKMPFFDKGSVPATVTVVVK